MFQIKESEYIISINLIGLVGNVIITYKTVYKYKNLSKASSKGNDNFYLSNL